MKTRIITLSVLAVAASTLFSCNKIENTAPAQEEKSGIPFEFIASNGPESKTTFDGAHTNWKSGDKVALFHAVANDDEYINDGAFEAGDDGASVVFSGTLASALSEPQYDWYAIYPYNVNITTPANTGTKGYVTIGSSYTGKQKQTKNSNMTHIAGTYYPLAGKVLGVDKDAKPAISMSQLTTVLAIEVTNETPDPISISEISFTGTEDIVGNFFVDFTGDPVVFTPRDGYTSSTATLQVVSGETFDNGESATFYLAVKPFTASASSTISFTVTGSNGTQNYNKVLSSNISFVAGTKNTIHLTYNKPASVIPEPTSKTGWYRVEKASWLAAGDRVVIANNDGTKAMSKAYKNNNRDGVDITTSADGDYTVLTHNENFQMFILESGSVDGSFAYWCDNGGNPSQYMYAASSSSNNLKFKDKIDGDSSFIADLVDGLGSLTAQGTNTHNVVQWNNLFNCYTTASYSAISIYKYYGTYSGPTECATPTITQEGALISISTTTEGATIYYTIDGSTPTSSSTKYTAPFSLAESATVKAIAIRSHYTDSGVASKACTAKVATPEISSSDNAFTITCTTPGVTIYYETSTVDLASVATPTTSSSVYSTAVAYDATTYVKAIAVKDGYDNSEIATATCNYSSGGGSTPKEVTIQYTGSTTSNMTGENDAATVGLDADKWSVVGAKGNNSNFPGLNKAGDIRIYWSNGGSNTITVTALETGVTINSITITYTGDTYKNGVVLVGGTPVAISEGSYPINSSSFVITNGNSSNVQVRISKIVISYTTSD